MAEFSIRKVLSRLHHKATDSDRVQQALDLFKRGAYKEAYDVLRKIMEKEPQLSESEMAFAYMLRADLELLAHGDVGEAQKSLDKVKEFDHPETDYYYRIQGDIKSRAGNPQAAIEYYEKSVALGPAVGNLIMLAQALSAVQDDRARDVWGRILQEDPENCFAHLGLAWHAARSGDRDGAVLMAKKAEQLNPSSKDAFEIGCVYHMVGDFQAAVSAYLRADSLGYGEKAKLHAAVAACYKQLGQDNQARQFAESALKCDPEDEYVKAIWQGVMGVAGETGKPGTATI